VPLHRTLTFQLGLFPIVILLWAWADSNHATTTWVKGDGYQDHRIVNEGFALHYRQSRVLREDPCPFGPTEPGVPVTHFFGGIWRYPSPGPHPPWNRLPSMGAEDRIERFSAVEVDAYHLPLWFILACYLPLWLGLSYWRSRSKLKRIAATLPTPPPAQPQSDLDLGT
jgi:hypothetical protein